MNSRVPVRLEWNGPSGEHISVDGHTRVVNPYGCMIVLEHSLELEDRLTLSNLALGTTNAAIVVWKGGARVDGWEYGIELLEPEMEFWGLEL